MSPHMIATAIALVRSLIGAALIAAPRLSARAWIGPDGDSPAVQVIARGLGARDLALGVGTLLALHHGSGVRGWVEAGALSDATDAAAVLLAWRALPSRARLLVLVSATAAALVGIAIARTIDEANEESDADADPVWVPHEPGRGAA